MVERDLALAAYERQPLHLLHLSAWESVQALRRARADGVAGDRRGDAAPPLPDRRGGPLARPEPEDEPAAALGVGPHGADRRAEGRDDHRDRDRPRAARATREGGPVRGGAVRRHRPRDGLRRALHAPRRAGADRARDAARADVRRPGAGVRARRAADRGRRRREPRPARPERELPRHRGGASARGR